VKKFSVITITLFFFALTVYLAFVQGGISLFDGQVTTAHFAPPTDISPVIYTGFQARLANLFAVVLNALMSVLGNNIVFAVIIIALIVELVLLYPSVNIQLKQKKIHLFHKKLVDRFNSGELSISNTKHELDIIYAVNEKIHARGGLLVGIQLIVFLIVLWGLNLVVQVPSLLPQATSIFQFDLLAKPTNTLIPVLAGLIYFFGAMVKIYYKQREDYISPTQSSIAVAIAFVTSSLVYWFSSSFAMLLTLYFVTLITFSIMRYIVVEQHAQGWGKHAKVQLIRMLQEAEHHKSKFEYFSRKWNHLPVVRHVNFHLLEEALSMTIGLILALNFFGVFA